jgi:hypothetical protein
LRFQDIKGPRSLPTAFFGIKFLKDGTTVAKHGSRFVKFCGLVVWHRTKKTPKKGPGFDSRRRRFYDFFRKKKFRKPSLYMRGARLFFKKKKACVFEENFEEREIKIDLSVCVCRLTATHTHLQGKRIFFTISFLSCASNGNFR